MSEAIITGVGHEPLRSASYDPGYTRCGHPDGGTPCTNAATQRIVAVDTEGNETPLGTMCSYHAAGVRRFPAGTVRGEWRDLAGTVLRTATMMRGRA